MARAATTSKTVENEVDLLADLQNETGPNVQDDTDYDLLSDMSESDATAWVPWNEEDQPNGIQGKVVHIGTVTQEAKFGGDDVPYIEIQDKDNPDLIWGVRGYSMVLESQLDREINNGLRVGDHLAVVYKGETSNRAHTLTYKNFAVKSRFVGH